MKLLAYLTALIAIATALNAAPKYPFPQNVQYPYGIKPASVDAAKIQKAFTDFMTLYEESGDIARIKWDTESYTVSEGIGYGMLILVYMDNTTNNTQAKFDKLWAYYKKFSGSVGGLMSWKVKGFTGPEGMNDKNAATDAELDVGAALLQAYKQWGDEKYLTDAKAFLEKVAKNEVTTDGYLKPGDSWESQFNPSYFSTGALQLFKQASSFDWDKVITNSYALIKKARNTSTGLPPDWCKKDGTPVAAVYKYDATRTPWRIAWAYCWYGHADAKDICTKIATWISAKTGNDASNVVDGYNLDGSATSEYNNATFVGPFACAGMVDAAHQPWLNNSYTLLSKMADTKDVYYQQSLKVMTLLLLSGNMPDLWSTTGTIRKAATRTGVSAATFNQTGARQLSFTTTSNGHVAINLFTSNGKLVSSIVDAAYTHGTYSATILSSIVPGTYIVRMTTTGSTLTKQVVLSR